MRVLFLFIISLLFAGSAGAKTHQGDGVRLLGDVDVLFTADCGNTYTSTLAALEASDPEAFRLDEGRQFEALAMVAQLFQEAASNGLRAWQGSGAPVSSLDLSAYKACPNILVAPDGRVSIYDRFACADKNSLPLLESEMTRLVTECSYVLTSVLSGKVWNSENGLGYPENLYEKAAK